MSDENKLSPVTVYVPIKPKPDEKNDPIKAKAVSYVTGETLEPQEKYVFNREELEGLLNKAFSAGSDYADDFALYTERGRKVSVADNATYIQSLF